MRVSTLIARVVIEAARAAGAAIGEAVAAHVIDQLQKQQKGKRK